MLILLTILVTDAVHSVLVAFHPHQPPYESWKGWRMPIGKPIHKYTMLGNNTGANNADTDARAHIPPPITTQIHPSLSCAQAVQISQKWDCVPTILSTGSREGKLDEQQAQKLSGSGGSSMLSPQTVCTSHVIPLHHWHTYNRACHQMKETDWISRPWH